MLQKEELPCHDYVYPPDKEAIMNKVRRGIYMKKVFLIAVVVLVIFFSVFYTEIHSRPELLPEATLVKSFSHSGARVVSSEIYLWGKVDVKSDTMSELKLLSEELSKELGMVRDSSFSNKASENDLVKKIELKGMDSQKRAISIQSEEDKGTGGPVEGTVSIDVVQDSSDTGLEEVRQAALKVLKKYHIDPRINSCVIGSFDGKLDYTAMNDVCKRMFEDAEARKVEGIRDGNLISVSAYSPFIGDSIKVNGKKVNMNVAIRYNALENKTYLWLATPVITTEY